MEWLRAWDLLNPNTNPPNRDRLPASMDYLRLLAMDCNYIAQLGQTESIKAYNRRIYNTIHALLPLTKEPPDMRISRLWPDTHWATVWKNVQATPVPETTKVIWYRVLHDILPTNERLYNIRLAPNDRCLHCDRKDTILHRLTNCGDGEIVWDWTRQKIAAMLQTDQRRIPPECLLGPKFRLWPPHRHRAVLSVLAQLVLYRAQQ